jgi:phosphohistidine phosphatase
MPKLYLLRHAEAASAFGLPDQQRPLTAHGILQAEKTADALRHINLALCSAAERTKMTLQAAVNAGASIQKTEILAPFYNAPAETLLKTIQESDKGDILVIAHNPGIHQLAASMARRDDTPAFNNLMTSYSPASLAVFDCDIENWSELQLHQNKLVELITQD